MFFSAIVRVVPRRPSAAWTLGFVASLAIVGCQSPPPKTDSAGRTPVTLALNWFPDAQHGGFIAALVQSDYAAEGLDVTIVPGGPNVPVIQNVVGRRVDFAIANADDLLLARDQEAPVVALFAPLQESPRCILVHEATGIERFEDLRDLTLALGSGKPFAQFLQAKIPLTNVRVVPYSGSVAALLRDERYAQQGYIFSEPLIAQRQGAKVRSLLVSDLGFNPYTSVLFTHQATIAERPEIVARFVRAVRRGWRRYLESPDATNQEIFTRNPEVDLESLAYGAAAIRPLCLPNDMPPDELGAMSLARWRTLADQLVELKLIDPAVDPSAAFDTRFLDQARESDGESAGR